MYLVAMIKVNYVGSQFSGVSELRCDDPSLSCRSRSQTYSSAHVGAAAGKIVGNFHHIIRTLYKENNNVTIVHKTTCPSLIRRGFCFVNQETYESVS